MSIYQVGFRDLKEEEAAVFGTYYVRARSEKEAEEKVLRRTRETVAITYSAPFRPDVKRHLVWVWFWTLFGPYDDGSRRIFGWDEPTQYIMR